MKKTIDNIFEDDLGLTKIIDSHVEELDKYEWKSNDKFNCFLEYLVDYTNKNNVVMSDDFYYKEDMSYEPYSRFEFEKYLHSLFNIVHEYALKYSIFNKFNIYNDAKYLEGSYCLKIKNKFYNIQRSGEFSNVLFELVPIKHNYKYIDYDLMILGQAPISNSTEKFIKDTIDELIVSLAKLGIETKIIRKTIKEYAEEI